MEGGLQYFGVALHSAGDLTSDALTDVIVGSRGAVTVLRQVCMLTCVCVFSAYSCQLREEKAILTCKVTSHSLFWFYVLFSGG